MCSVLFFYLNGRLFFVCVFFSSISYFIYTQLQKMNQLSSCSLLLLQLFFYYIFVFWLYLSQLSVVVDRAAFSTYYLAFKSSSSVYCYCCFVLFFVLQYCYLFYLYVSSRIQQDLFYCLFFYCFMTKRCCCMCVSLFCSLFMCSTFVVFDSYCSIVFCFCILSFLCSFFISLLFLSIVHCSS